MPRAADDLDACISNAWQELDPPGGMATRWFLVVEGIDEQGDRSLDYFWSADLKTWDVKGMLNEALDSQVAGQVADEIRDGD